MGLDTTGLAPAPAGPPPAGTPAPPALPGDLHDAVEAHARHWADVLVHDGYDVHGDVADLLPPTAQRGARRAEPLELALEERLEITAAALVEAQREVDRLREQNEELLRRTARLERKRRNLEQRRRALVDADR